MFFMKIFFKIPYIYLPVMEDACSKCSAAACVQKHLFEKELLDNVNTYFDWDTNDIYPIKVVFGDIGN